MINNKILAINIEVAIVFTMSSYLELLKAIARINEVKNKKNAIRLRVFILTLTFITLNLQHLPQKGIRNIFSIFALGIEIKGKFFENLFKLCILRHQNVKE